MKLIKFLFSLGIVFGVLLCVLGTYVTWSTDPMVYFWEDISWFQYTFAFWFWPGNYLAAVLPGSLFLPTSLLAYVLLGTFELIYLSGLFFFLYSLIKRKPNQFLKKFYFALFIASLIIPYPFKNYSVSRASIKLQAEGIGCGWKTTRLGESCFWNPFIYFEDYFSLNPPDKQFCSQSAQNCLTLPPFSDVPKTTDQT